MIERLFNLIFCWPGEMFLRFFPVKKNNLADVIGEICLGLIISAVFWFVLLFAAAFFIGYYWGMR